MTSTIITHVIINHHSQKNDFNALALGLSPQKKSPPAVTAEEDIPKTDYILIYLRHYGRDKSRLSLLH